MLKDCIVCSGTGYDKYTGDVCEACEGEGYVYIDKREKKREKKKKKFREEE